MYKKYMYQLVFVFLLLSADPSVFAQDDDTDNPGYGHKTKYGIGLQYSSPVYGFSGMMDINQKITIQAMVGFYTDLLAIGGKVRYKFQQTKYWNIYGYGLIGPAWFTSLKEPTFEEMTESTIFFGLGAGFEYDWKAWSQNLPPIYWNFEIGYSHMNFSDLNYDESGILFGGGIHYMF